MFFLHRLILIMLCTTSEKQTVGYYGQFRIPTLKYLASYSNNVSAEYEELATDVKETVC